MDKEFMIVSLRTYIPLLKSLSNVSKLNYIENCFNKDQIIQMVDKNYLILNEAYTYIFLMVDDKDEKHYASIQRKERDVVLSTAELDEKTTLGNNHCLVLPNQWINLYDLRAGAIFKTKYGVRAVKSKYYRNHQPLCILLTGEYGYFKKGNSTLVKEIFA